VKQSWEGLLLVTVMPAGEDGLPASCPPWFLAALAAELPRLQRTVVKLVDDPRLRDDVVQESIVRAWRSWRSFDASRDMWPWLRRLAVVSAAVLARADRPDGEVVGTTTPGLSPGSDEHAVVLDLRHDVRSALGRLPVQDRSLLWCRDVEDLPYELLASMAGGTPGGARQAVSRARRRFRVAYLAVVEAGNGCLVALTAPVGRWRQRVANRTDPACERLVQLLSASAAAAVAAAVVTVAVPAAVVVRAAEARVGFSAGSIASDPSAAGAPPRTPAAAPPRTSGAGPTGTPSRPVAVSRAPGVRLGAEPAGSSGAGLEQPTPATDAIWYQGVVFRCDRSKVLSGTCTVIRATPLGDGLEATVPTGTGS
jgi:RNA polymerase sigma-70 factor (ECF subfamily)